MTLQEEHYKAIEDATAGLFSEETDYLSVREKAAKDSTEITKQYMKGFAEWTYTSKEAIEYKDKLVFGQIDYTKMIDDLIELYLTEKQSQ